MDHIQSVRAALKAASVKGSPPPVVAIPVEGHAPVCIKAKLLKGALKGVTIDSVELLDNGWLKVIGHAQGVSRTCSKFAPMNRILALRQISDWAERERKKRVLIINQGVLSAEAQRELKLKEAEKAGIAELLKAQREEKEILESVKERINPVLTPVDPETRQEIIQSYAAYRAQHRKRGAVIRWQLAKLRKEKAEMVTVKREYEERPRISPFARRKRVMVGEKTVLRRKKDAVRYAAVIYQIGELEKQYKALYADVWVPREYWSGGGYYRDPWIDKRPKDLPYTPPYGYWSVKNETAHRKHKAEHLKNVRGDIRALTPPQDKTEEFQIAA
jgi:hypothetical protein